MDAITRNTKGASQMSDKTKQANTEFIEDMFKLLDKYYIRKSQAIPISELEKLIKRLDGRSKRLQKKVNTETDYEHALELNIMKAAEVAGLKYSIERLQDLIDKKFTVGVHLIDREKTTPSQFG